MLVVMRSADDPASAKVTFDPNSDNAKGSLSVEFYVPSFGGKYVAAAISENGSEDCSAHIFEVATGKELSDIVPRVNFATAGGSIAWKADSSGFYYTRYPQGDERPPEDANFYQQVYFHKLGTDPKQDTYVIGKDFPRITFGHLYVIDIMGGPSRVPVFDNKGQALPAPALPPISAVYGGVPVAAGDVLFFTSTYLEPPAWYRLDAATGKAVRTALFETSPVTFGDTEVVREFATSKDGTRVLLNIIRRRGTRLEGANPTLLYGYGGYGISTKPYFLRAFGRLWLDAGGVYVDANIRGGAEYGEEWHLAGNLTRKQNVFDDFIACAQYLVDQKYTSPAHLAILGGNGGLLMGAAFTQRPDLFRAVVSFVGIYDMLRVELDPNGEFNVTEFGTVKDSDQFHALYAYSPYHHVKDGTAYPAILMPTGENDHRVNPMQSRKMVARLQATNSSDHPILLRTSSSSGHGIGTALDERIEEDADVFSFLFDQLGIQYTGK